MYLISAKEYGNAGVDFSRGKKTGKMWAKMKNVQDGLGVQNISDLVSKEIYAIYKTKNLTKYQIKKHKLIEREVFEKYYNLSEDELNTKSNKNFYVKNDVMTTVIKCCRGEKKSSEKKKMDPEKKLWFQTCRMSRTRSQIKNRKHICEQKNTRGISC